MIVEMAVLNVTPGRAGEFESAFATAQSIIAAAAGYVSHQLLRCVETPNRYLLLVQWHSLEDHMEGFRQSDAFQEWRRLLHHFYDPFPTVEHYTLLHGGGT